MPPVTHLKSLQALELALREGSLKAAADVLGITPAAVGQRIRSLETALEMDLLARGRSGLQPSADLEPAIADLRAGFAALDRVTETLNFQHASEVHVVADPDWAELWLMPRIGAFRQANPKVLFCINGSGDVPVRLGVPDIRVEFGTRGDLLYEEMFLPVTSPDNIRRLSDFDPVLQMEGMPLLHLEAHRSEDAYPGWVEWFRRYGLRREGPDRGVYHRNTRMALEAVRQDVGFLVCGLSLAAGDLDRGAVELPFPAAHHLTSRRGYRVQIRDGAERRPQVQKFIAWLHEAAQETAADLRARTA